MYLNEEIKNLYEDKVRLLNHLERIGMANINGQSTEKQIELDMQYRICKKDADEAIKKYNDAIDKLIN